jgi:hypothetical protein
MILTKHKSDKPGAWCLRLAGKDLPFTLEKGDPPKYRMPQNWYIMKGDGVMFEGRSAAGLMHHLQAVIDAACGISSGAKS